MRVMAAAIVAMLGLAVFAGPSDAALLITIDKAKQRMIVSRDDVPLHDWPVSTGQRGYDTQAVEPFLLAQSRHGAGRLAHSGGSAREGECAGHVTLLRREPRPPFQR